MSSIREIAMAKAIGGGGPSVTVEPLSVNQNGTTVAPAGKAYSPVNVNVPNTYSAGDEGKVVSNGALVGQTAHATVTENGTIDTTLNNSVVVDVPQGGGGGVASNAVNFRDYDGTIVAAYSAADFAALTALPANPSHDGLTAQGWNWSLADAQAYVAKYRRLEIGQMYITDDDNTRVYIHLEQGRTSPMLGCYPNNNRSKVDVDWGDGTAYDTLNGTKPATVKWTPNHAYAAPGDYVIKLTTVGMSMSLCGDGLTDQFAALLRHTSDEDTRNYVYLNAIQNIEIGNSVTSIREYAFSGCDNLTSVTIPNSVTSIGEYAFAYCDSLTRVTIPNSVTIISADTFQGCRSLTSVTIPNSVTKIDNSAFFECYNLTSVTIPNSVTIIKDYAFAYCRSLASVTIPASVTNIYYYAFQSCSGVAEYHLAPTTPPKLFSTNAFNGIPDDCIIYVPYSADHSILEAYKTASNWSNYASRMQEEAA